MGILDGLLGKAMGALGGKAGESDLVQSVLNQFGGSQTSGTGPALAGLVKAFEAGGLSNVVNSWIGTGSNLPITPDQIEKAIGSDRLAALAAKAGISPDTVRSTLAQVLPGIVDKLTPNGKIPPS
jgi:uncharacterized protein YidB (DUF937 family)